MLLGRLFSYPDAHRYRIGTNYLQLPVNQLEAPVHSYNKEGSMAYRHSGNQPVYAPNSYGGPKADPAHVADPGWAASGEMVRSAYTLHAEDDDFGQAGTLYRKTLSATEKEHLETNIIGHMSQDVERFIQERAVKLWYHVDQGLGEKIAQGLGLESKATQTASAD